MQSKDVIADGYGRVRGIVHAALADLTPEQLTFRVDPDANTIAWLVWHLTRVQDSHLAELIGSEEVWTAAGWVDRFGPPFDRLATGYGHSSQDVAAVHADAFLLGRRTYQIFASHWPKVTDPENPIASRLNALPKYVASRSLATTDWHNSTLLSGDIVADIARLKNEPGDELQVHGSGNLAQTLIEHDLIDEYRLFFFPVHLGTGKKLFPDGAKAAALRLVTSSTTAAGVIAATYQPAGPVRYGSYALEDD
jgi:dihydrofolate reductase